MVMATILLTSTPAEQTNKPTVVSPKVQDSILDELVKGIQEMQLKLTRLENKGQSSEHKPQNREGMVLDAYGVMIEITFEKTVMHSKMH